jgi:hypothetical protein
MEGNGVGAAEGAWLTVGCGESVGDRPTKLGSHTPAPSLASEKVTSHSSSLPTLATYGEGVTVRRDTTITSSSWARAGTVTRRAPPWLPKVPNSTAEEHVDDTFTQSVQNSPTSHCGKLSSAERSWRVNTGAKGAEASGTTTGSVTFCARSEENKSGHVNQSIVGAREGRAEGATLGSGQGWGEGFNEGCTVGWSEGNGVGRLVGMVGTQDGWASETQLSNQMTALVALTEGSSMHVTRATTGVGADLMLATMTASTSVLFSDKSTDPKN